MICSASSDELEVLSGLSRKRADDLWEQEHQPPVLQRTGSDQPFNPERRLTDSLIGANLVIYAMQVLSGQQLTLLGLKVNALIDAGQYWRLLTPAFLHGGPAHLLTNCLSLSVLGPMVELTMGRPRMALLYLLAAVGGNVGSYLGDPEPSLGASGAIFGLAGALLVYFIRNRPLFVKAKADDIIRRLAITVVLNLGVGLLLPNIDEWGHLGGIAGGAAVAWLLGPRYEFCRILGMPGVWVVDDPPVQVPAPGEWTTRPKRIM